MKKILWIGLFLNLILMRQVSAQSFTATLNRNPVPEGETVVLTLDLQDVDTSATPDLSSLSKDLTVLSISNGYQTSIINGKVSKSRQWNLVMIPNQNGEILIPSLEIEGYKTQPIKLQVVSADKMSEKSQPNATPEAPKFKMTGNVTDTTPYIQQQINYRLKIYDAGGLQGEAPFFATTNDDWIIKNLGEPKVETKVVNGLSLREITFDYALFAQKSGELTVPPVRFNGYYLSKSTRRDPFARFFDEDDFFGSFGLHDVFANKNQVVLTTKPVKVNVRPAQSRNGWWLPAEKVEMSAEFDSARPVFKVGEAISRTIYIKAVGVLDTQLPELKFSEISGMKQYPEKPVTEMKVENGKVVTVAKIANVYIPSESGAMTLPEIKLNWFNTVTGQEQSAVIPEYKIIVEPGSGKQLDKSEDPEKPQISDKEKVMPASDIALQKADNKMTIFAFLAGIVLAAVVMAGGRLVSKMTDQRKKSVIKAAKEKDLRALRDELIKWTAQRFPNRPITNLQDVADAFDSENLNHELDKLREMLYAEGSKEWDETEFLKIFKRLSKQTKSNKRTTDDPLPKLYK